MYWLHFGVPNAIIRMEMKRNELEYIGLSETGIFGTAGRRNRFPCGRNRVPSSNFQKWTIFQRGNRFPVWVIRVPHTNFQGACFWKMWEPGSPREEPVTTVLNFKILKTLKIHIFQTVTPIRVPFSAVFLKLKILSYKKRKILFCENYFKKSRAPDFFETLIV